MNCLQQVNLERNHNEHGKTISINGENMKRLNCNGIYKNKISLVINRRTVDGHRGRPRPENVEKSPFVKYRFTLPEYTKSGRYRPLTNKLHQINGDGKYYSFTTN